MKRILLFTLLFSCRLAMAQHIPDYGINRVRLNEEDRMLLFETIPKGNLPDAVPGKTYFWYSSGRIQHTQGGYSGKLLNGVYKSYYLNKNLMEEGFFHKGLRHGNWKKWDASGILTETSTWENGLQNGPFQNFDSTGRVLTSGRYRKGQINGTLIRFITQDSTVSTYYKNGVITQPVPVWKKINPFRRKKIADAKTP